MHAAKYWDPEADSDTTRRGVLDPKNAAAASAKDDKTPFLFRVGGNSTVVMSDYHICKYDAILGVLVCIGDDANVMVLGKEMCRELMPLPHGVHWLDAYVYTGTTSFLVMSPEMLLCLDYSTGLRGDGDSCLRFNGSGTELTCLHIPQGLTCGAVGRKDGTVSYFRLDPVSTNPQERPQLRWTTKETNVLALCLPFCPELGRLIAVQEKSDPKFFVPGAVLAMDSYPSNPNAIIGVVAGAPGVCKWYIDEGRLSCFFDAKSIAAQADHQLATCRVTPGGVYVAAMTMHCTSILLWNENKKRRDKVAELYWVVDLSSQISRGVSTSGSSLEESFAYNEYRVGLHMARTALEDSFHATNDKHSQMYLLVHGQRDILEVVIRLDDKQVVRQDAIIASLNAYTAEKGVEAAKQRGKPTASTAASAKDPMGNSLVENYFNVFHVEPCVLTNYWNSGLTDVDLEALFVTSEDGLRPILAKRNRQTGGIESIKELRELSASASWYPNAMLLRLPENQLRSLAREVQRTAMTSTWEKLLRGGDTLLQHAALDVESLESATSDVAQLWRQSIIVTVTDAAQGVYLSPQSNEAFSVKPKALQNCVPWSTLAIGHDVSGLLLEQALPSLQNCFLATEIILRVFSTESLLVVMKLDIRRNAGSLILNLDRVALHLDGSGEEGKHMVQQAVLVNARLEPSTVTSKVNVYKDGKSLLLLLDDNSIALVDLCGKGEDGQPYMLQVPAGLLPVGARTISLDAFWMAEDTTNAASATTGLLCLACLFGDGKGFLLWNLSEMRMISYGYPQYAASADRLTVTAAAQPPLPNISGDINSFDIAFSIATPPDHAGEYGKVVCCDALGASLFVLHFGFGVAAGHPKEWCYREVADEEWRAVLESSASSRVLQLHCEVAGSSVEWSLASNGSTPVTASSSLHGSAVHIKSTWQLGKSELTYTTNTGEIRSYFINCEASANDLISPAIAFVGPQQIAVVEVSGFFPPKGAKGAASASFNATPLSSSAPAAMCRLDPARRLEHFSVYHGRGALIVVTRDTNGWRWVNILDHRTTKLLMQPYATLDFAGEENIQVLLVEIENILHLYFLGSSNGVVGHFFVEANLGGSLESSIRKHPCFQGPQYHFTPCTFRGYGRFLPPAPTLKQETGFFKRLMTLPWVDIALKLESETLRETKPIKGQSAAPSPPQRDATAPVPAELQPSTVKVDTTKEREELLREAKPPIPRQPYVAKLQPGATAAPSPPPLPAGEPPGGRYAKLKAIADRENVSLTEARRMMSENVRKLQQRGERLDEIQEKSAQLAQNALTFQDLARQLKEKQRSSWL